MKKTDSREKVRAFIAIELPEDIMAAIETVQRELKSLGLNVRWSRPKSIHLTLKFLGDISAADVDKIGNAMTQCAKNGTAVNLAAKGLGVFPNMKRPRVIWVGLAGETEALAEFQSLLESDLEALGFPKEERLFRGHLTLGRVRGTIDRDHLRNALKRLEGFESRPFTANEVILFRSELKPEGAVYTRLKSARLAK